MALAPTAQSARTPDTSKGARGRHAPCLSSVLSGDPGHAAAPAADAAAYLALARSRITEHDAELYTRFLRRTEERLGQAAEASI